MPSQAAMNDGFLGVIDWREAHVDAFQRELVKVARRMDAEIEREARRFTLREGAFFADDATIVRLDRLRADLDRILDEAGYRRTVKGFVDRYPELQERVTKAWNRAGIEAQFSTVDQAAIRGDRLEKRLPICCFVPDCAAQRRQQRTAVCRNEDQAAGSGQRRDGFHIQQLAAA